VKTKTKPQKGKDNNMKCAKQKCKQIFIMIKYENVNTKGTKQSLE
jgi:hypothetical protein